MKTIIVNLELNRVHNNFEIYNNFSVQEKIDFLKNSINEIYSSLIEQNPQDEIMMVWREYGITEPPSKKRRSISTENRYKFIEAMKEASNKANLTIIAGTIPSFKPKYNKIALLNIYTQNETIDEYEKNNPNLVENQYKQHQLKITELSTHEFTQIRNTCYVFFEGKKIAKRDKIAPFNETIEDQDLINPVFKPGKNIELIQINDKKILIEICREHIFPIQDTIEKADIHFILSDSINFIPEKKHGELVVYTDSYYPPEFYMSTSEAQDRFILYSIDILSNMRLSNTTEPYLIEIDNLNPNSPLPFSFQNPCDIFGADFQYFFNSVPPVNFQITDDDYFFGLGDYYILFDQQINCKPQINQSKKRSPLESEQEKSIPRKKLKNNFCQSGNLSDSKNIFFAKTEITALELHIPGQVIRSE